MALSNPRTDIRYGEVKKVLIAPIAASTKAIQGGLAMIDAGYFKPGAAATSKIAAGVFRATYDNTSGSAGAIVGEVECGDFWFKNSSAGDAIAQADVGADCYIVDDETVAKTNGSSTRSRAGKILAVGSLGVCVQLQPGL